MTEAIFFELKSKKVQSFILNFILIFGLFFFEIPNQDKLPEVVGQLDFILTIIFGVPLVFQFLLIFYNSQIHLDKDTFSESITFCQHEIPRSEIIGYRFIKLLWTRYLILDLRDPNTYIKNLPFWKRALSWYDYKQVKSPIKIPIGRLDKPLNEIYESIKQVHGV